MTVIERADIDGQFVEILQLEVGTGADLFGGLGQERECSGDHPGIAPRGDPGSAQIEGNRTEPLVGVRLHLAAVLEDGDGPVSQKIVQ